MAEETAGQAKTEAVGKKAPEPKTRPLDYLMVQHMGYAAETRAQRHLKAGNRRQRFMLDDGRRIRDKGERFDEVAFSDVLANFNMLLGGVQNGTIRVCRPDNLQELTLEQFADLGEQLAKDFKKDLKIDETLLEPLVGSDLTDKQAWVEKDKDVTKPDMGQSELLAKVDQHEAEASGEANPPPSEAGGEGETVLTEEQMMEMTVKDLQKLAKDYGVKHPEKLKSKKDLVDAILAEASKEQE